MRRFKPTFLHNFRCKVPCPILTIPNHPSKTLKISPFPQRNFPTTFYNVR